VTNPEDLAWNVLSIAISQLAGIYHMDRVPILSYPFDYVTAKKIPYEKQYQLCVGLSQTILASFYSGVHYTLFGACVPCLIGVHIKIISLQND
jgi:hypothetical protein